MEETSSSLKEELSILVQRKIYSFDLVQILGVRTRIRETSIQ